MADLDKALQTQLANIQKKTGKSLDELYGWIRATGLAKHGEIRDRLKTELGLGHGDANTLVTLYLRPAPAASASEGTGAAGADAAVAEIYAGPKAPLLPIHEAVMAAIGGFGPFELAPKKGYISLRRKKQFAMVGPATKTQVEVGLNMKGVDGTGRLVALPPGGMCQYKVRLSAPTEVDAELVGWIRNAYDAAG